MDFAKLKTKAKQNRNNMRWCVVFAVGAWWDKTITVYVNAPRQGKQTLEEFIETRRAGINLDYVIKEAVEKADELLDRRADRAGQEPPLVWDLALIRMELC